MSSVPSPFAYDFSIWYCPEDDLIASRIAQRLRREGFCGYAEHRDQAAGTPRVRGTLQALQTSRVAILLLSAAALQDPWCQRVCQWGLGRAVGCGGARLIPVCVGVGKAQLPPFLHHLTRLDYQAEFFFDRLLGSLRRSCLAVGKGRPAPAAKAKS